MDKCYCNKDQGAGYTFHDEHGPCDVCLAEIEEEKTKSNIMKTFYFHPTVTTQYRGKTVQRRATVAAILEFIEQVGEQASPDPFRLKFGVSICSEKDQFLKRYGRDSAMGKATSKSPTKIVTPTKAFDSAKELNAYFVSNAIFLLNEKGYEVQQKTNQYEPALDTN